MVLPFRLRAEPDEAAPDPPLPFQPRAESSLQRVRGAGLDSDRLAT
jgi:hypothetical protein